MRSRGAGVVRKAAVEIIKENVKGLLTLRAGEVNTGDLRGLNRDEMKTKKELFPFSLPPEIKNFQDYSEVRGESERQEVWTHITTTASTVF